jgi:hypothetical protein
VRFGAPVLEHAQRGREALIGTQPRPYLREQAVAEHVKGNATTGLGEQGGGLTRRPFLDHRLDGGDPLLIRNAR